MYLCWVGIVQEIRDMLENRLVRVNQALAGMEAQCAAQCSPSPYASRSNTTVFMLSYRTRLVMLPNAANARLWQPISVSTFMLLTNST
jgi:hypothetical protein